VRSRRAAGLLLLALTAHAFVASATHFHRLPPIGAAPAQTIFQSEEENGKGAPLSGDEKQCLLCRLQRNLVTDLQHAALVIAAPLARTFVPEPLQATAARAGTVLLRQGRAPPAILS